MITKSNIDGGYAWVVLLSCVVIQFLTDGVMKSFGLFYVAIIAKYKQSVSVTTLISGLMNGIFCLSTMPVMMILIKALTPRKIVMLGCLLTAAGYSVSCLAENIYLMFFTLSLMVGTGMSMIYPPSIYILGTYFEKRRAMANGIATSGCCIGGLLCPPIYQYLLDTYGLQGAFLLTGAILLHNIPMACLLRSNRGVSNVRTKNSKDILNTEEEIEMMVDEFKLEPNRHITKYLSSSDRGMCIQDEEERDKIQNGHNSYCIVPSENTVDNVLLDNTHILDLNLCKYLDANIAESCSANQSTKKEDNDIKESSCHSVCVLLFNFTFIIFVISNALASIVAVTFLSFLPLYAKENGIDEIQFLILVSLTGAVDFIGRILIGFLADRPQFETHHILALSQAVCGIAYNCNHLMTTFPGLIIFCVIIGLFGGAQLVLMFTHIIEIVGLELSPSALSIAIMFQLPAFILGPLVFGLLRDATGNFEASFYVVGTIALLSAVLFMCETLCKRCTTSDTEKYTNIRRRKK